MDYSTFFGSRHPSGLKKNLAAPLIPLCGTLVCHGTPVGNHWSTVWHGSQIGQAWLSRFQKQAPP